jgi:hypothetical protein
MALVGIGDAADTTMADDVVLGLDATAATIAGLPDALHGPRLDRLGRRARRLDHEAIPPSNLRAAPRPCPDGSMGWWKRDSVPLALGA